MILMDWITVVGMVFYIQVPVFANSRKNRETPVIAFVMIFIVD